MKRCRYIWIGLTVVVSLAVGRFVLQQRSSGPRYQGNTVEQWLATLQPDDDVRTNLAIRTMLAKLGPSAIPPLMEVVDRDYSQFDKLFLRVLCTESLPEGVRSAAAKRVDYRQWHAAFAIALTGTNALMAIPQLERLICDTNRPSGNASAMYALARIGRPAIPTLTRLLTNAPPDRQGRLNSLLEMEWLTQLRTGDLEAREQAALALSELFPTLYENIPILASMCESSDAEKREAALEALSKTEALSRLAPEFAAARNAVRRAAESDDPNTRRIANEILETNRISRSLKPVE